MTVKKVPLKWKGEDATLILLIDNSEVIKGQQAIMQVTLNKVLLAGVSHEL